jgi:prepilin peptidase CpaA
MLPGHVFGGTGLGDVKLFAAAGALLGPSTTVTAFLFTAIVGGALAIAIAVRRRRLLQTIGGTSRLVTSPKTGGAAVKATEADNRFAYAPAIAVGVMASILFTL